MIYEFSSLKHRYRKPDYWIYFVRENVTATESSHLKLVVSNPKVIRLQDTRSY